MDLGSVTTFLAAANNIAFSSASMGNNDGAQFAAGSAMANASKRLGVAGSASRQPLKATPLVGGSHTLRPPRPAPRPTPKRMPPYEPPTPPCALDHERRIATPSEHLMVRSRPSPAPEEVLAPGTFDPASRPLDEEYITRDQQRSRCKAQREAHFALTGEYPDDEPAIPNVPTPLKSALVVAKGLASGSAYKGTGAEMIHEVFHGKVERSDLVTRNRRSRLFKPDWYEPVPDSSFGELLEEIAGEVKGELKLSHRTLSTSVPNASKTSRQARMFDRPTALVLDRSNTTVLARRPEAWKASAPKSPSAPRLQLYNRRPYRRGLQSDEILVADQRPKTIVPPETVKRKPVPPPREPVIRKPLVRKPLPPSPDRDSSRRRSVCLPARPATSAGQLPPPDALFASRFSFSSSEATLSAKKSPVSPTLAALVTQLRPRSWSS